MPKITPFLWFDNNAEEAANFYTSIFKDSKIKAIHHYGEDCPGPKGSVMTVAFTIEGQEFTALNGGPTFKFTEAVSFVVHCKTQDEVDHYYSKLIADGGKEIQCGWVKDKFGLAWQITPDILFEFLGDKDKEKAQRVMQAMMQMRKIDIAKLKQAYEQS
ncbi:MAG TPA: VOC family protein [Terriglobales bacterium]|jgi:predicted 3-demethylubiquinone-9 3-methyltransferase (glyoxalase superfamily)